MSSNQRLSKTYPSVILPDTAHPNKLSTFKFKPYATCEKNCDRRFTCETNLKLSFLYVGDGSKRVRGVYCKTMNAELSTEDIFIVDTPSLVSKLDDFNDKHCQLHPNILLKKDYTCAIAYRCPDSDNDKCYRKHEDAEESKTESNEA